MSGSSPAWRRFCSPGSSTVCARHRARNRCSLWTTLVQRKEAKDDDILKAAAARFRLPVADLNQVDQKARDAVPEPLVRRFNIIPIGISDSYLEIATANPNDIDAEKDLAFATGREVRMHLCSPSRIAEKMDELYRGSSEVMTQLLGNMDDGLEVTQLDDNEGLADLSASADEAEPAAGGAIWST